MRLHISWPAASFTIHSSMGSGLSFRPVYGKGHSYLQGRACFIDVREFQVEGCGLFFCRIPFHMGGAEHACLREALAFWHCCLGNIRSGEPLHPGKDTGGGHKGS
ncbi:hypothetical protein [Commensalibacter melissae]|uniref:hypothetical protein n=1 Tax=Commensalibacter melissae TaxID=2070537 RepID=UPI0018DBA224|nr:hypothetical protein [Commensalibacter melissae]MBH9973859.1 hypothetical protein [Commensalibacter melissae]